MSYEQMTAAGRYVCISPRCFEDRVLLGSKARWRLSFFFFLYNCSTVLIELRCAFWCLTCKLKSRTSRQERWKRGQGSDGNFETSSCPWLHCVVILFCMSCALSVSSVLIHVCVCACVCVCVCVCGRQGEFTDTLKSISMQNHDKQTFLLEKSAIDHFASSTL